MRIDRLLSPFSVLVASFAIALLACGGGEEAASSSQEAAAPVVDPEAIRADIEALQARSEGQQAEVLAAERALEAAGAALQGARAELEETQLALGEAQSRLAVAAPPPPRRTDAELFRLVQLQLLEAEALAQVAIGVTVEGGTVVLHGRAPDAATRDTALEIARAAAAPAPIRNDIEVN